MLTYFCKKNRLISVRYIIASDFYRRQPPALVMGSSLFPLLSVAVSQGSRNIWFWCDHKDFNQLAGA